MTTTDNRPPVDDLRKALEASTQGRWGITTYNGGFSWNGPKTLYCGTDPNYGEPRKIPDSDADKEFIVCAHNDLPAILAYIEQLETERKNLERLCGRAADAIEGMVLCEMDQELVAELRAVADAGEAGGE